MRAVVEKCGQSYNFEYRNGELQLDGIVVRVLRINENNSEREAWLRVSGDKDKVKMFEQILRRTDGVRYQLVYDAYYSKIYRVVYSKQLCNVSRCPYLNPPFGTMAKTFVVMPCGVIVEYILSKSSLTRELKKYGCQILLSHSIDEIDYLLTQRQEYALVHAYLRGYYSYPRKVSLKELASELGMSVSTLAELLRRAEAKVIEAFIRHEIPHYLIKRILEREMVVLYEKQDRSINRKASDAINVFASEESN
ncbi:MAG TPA: hypothetical protein EYH08_01535 [Pyrodictium sp.]|nr:hypothetical protein [Pyrodictium sp.]